VNFREVDCVTKDGILVDLKTCGGVDLTRAMQRHFWDRMVQDLVDRALQSALDRAAQDAHVKLGAVEYY